jgi:hypothetical protein
MDIIDLWYALNLFFNDLHPNFCDEYVEDSSDIDFISITKDFFDKINPPPEV